LKKTNMTDYVATLYCELEGVDDAPKEYAEKRQEVLSRLERFEEETEKITDLLGREDVVTSLRSDKVANLEFLKKEHDVSLFFRFLPGTLALRHSEGGFGQKARIKKSVG